jgi:hypothetical protein
MNMAQTMVNQIIKLNTYEELLQLEKELKQTINNEYMPSRPYV